MNGTNAHASSSTPRKQNIVYIQDEPSNTALQRPFKYHRVAHEEPVICIDNGSHSWRAGFSSMAEPYIDRTNVISRYKERKQGKNTLLFGRDCEVDANSRSNGRQMFDGDMLIHGDLLECALDFTFVTLGINTPRIEHPILMTERLANPLFTRAMTSEILFELYNAPSVTYGVDSLFAFSRQKHPDGLAFGLGHNSSTVIPVISGRGVSSRAKRIPWGGSQAAELMLKLAQMKYPSFPTKVTLPQATFMSRETCYFAVDYEAELRTLADPQTLSATTVVAQFPFIVADTVEKSEAELAAAAERRKENGRRLQEMQARQRVEKLAAKVAELADYKAIMAERVGSKRSDWLSNLAETTPFETEQELDSWIKKTEVDLKRKQRKSMGDEMEPEEDPTFPLVDRPDEELNEDEIKEKRRQRLMKAGWDARAKVREEKRKEKERQEEEQREEAIAREKDLESWADGLRAEQDDVISRMNERRRKRAQLGDRKSAVAQNRMQVIAALAAEEKAGKKRKKGDDKDDGFGRDDADWLVYREVGGDEDSDAEEDDQNHLQSLEERLLRYDPTFSEDDTMIGRVNAKNALLNAFVRGGTTERYDPDDVQQNHQLHLNVERIRVPETWFQPAMFGLDCAGLSEIAGWVLNGYEEEERRRLMQCTFVTGGSASIPNLLPKLRHTLTPLLPFRAPLKIVSSLDGGDPRLEAWKGMAEWSRSEEAKAARVTRQEYEEHGGEWLKEHAWGNAPP